MIRYFKADPTTYVLRYLHGRLFQKGAGLSFFYLPRTNSIAALRLGSVEAPFMIESVSMDFQHVTAQGHVTYRIAEPERAAQLLDFVLTPSQHAYRSKDPEKLPERIVRKVEVLLQQRLGRTSLRDALQGAETLGAEVARELGADREIEALGIEVLGFSILAIRPVPETARALEAEAREEILRRADEALYARRNAAVEQERGIRENELSTEIAVEAKKRQIRETQMDAEAAVQAKQHEIDASRMAARIRRETQNHELVDLAATNSRTEADARAYGMTTLMKSFGAVDPKVLQTLATVGMDPGQLLASAFQGLAERAERIGQLNVSPDLLREILDRKKE